MAADEVLTVGVAVEAHPLGQGQGQSQSQSSAGLQQGQSNQ
jgi:hypothetical protein